MTGMSFTVTATQGGSSQNDMSMTVKVVTGASVTGTVAAATATQQCTIDYIRVYDQNLG